MGDTEPIYLTGSNTCGSCGLVIAHNAKMQHAAFHETFVRKGTPMSNVNWCDPGEHAFKAGEPGSLSFAGTGFDKDGNPVRQQMDACGRHNPMNVTSDIERAITAQHFNDTEI